MRENWRGVLERAARIVPVLAAIAFLTVAIFWQFHYYKNQLLGSCPPPEAIKNPEYKGPISEACTSPDVLVDILRPAIGVAVLLTLGVSLILWVVARSLYIAFERPNALKKPAPANQNAIAPALASLAGSMFILAVLATLLIMAYGLTP